MMMEEPFLRYAELKDTLKPDDGSNNSIVTESQREQRKKGAEVAKRRRTKTVTVRSERT